MENFQRRNGLIFNNLLSPVASNTRRHLGKALLLGVLGMALPWSANAAEPASKPKVRLSTSLGDIVVQLDPAKAPKTVANFLQYVKDKHYDGTIFHRVMSNFMIQGGGFGPDLRQKATREPIPLEANNGLKNDRGTIAMARTANPNSATAQFFINVVDNAALNAPSPDGFGYAVFGKVIEGMDVVDKITAVPVGNKGMHQNVPQQSVTILKATLEN
jgi:peptidyl-prolyl cis-trans isomerase A (cyclophilin A)